MADALIGTRVVADRSLRIDGEVLTGGSPVRMLRLTARGIAVVRQLLAGRPVCDRDDARLARRLIDAGLAHPLPDGGMPAATASRLVTALVPVRDRAEELRHTLTSLTIPAVVVDDGSREPADVQAICRDFDTRLVRRETSGGPAAARNTGLVEVTTPYVLCVDSDVVLPPATLPLLLAHLADPGVVAVAPRVRPADAAGFLGRYLQARSPLDLGPEPGMVRDGGRIGYVPTACLLLRTETLTAIGAFDASLRFGEDVDACWRLIAAGGVVRYEPRAVAFHTEPRSWRAALARRHRYGTSAGPLGARHGARLAPYRSAPLPAATAVCATLAALPETAVVAAATTVATVRRLTKLGVPRRRSVAMAGQAISYGVIGLGRFAGGVGFPLAAAVVAAPGRRGRRLRRIALLVIAPTMFDYVIRKPRLDPARWLVASLIDDVAYASGVWRGAVRHWTVTPLIPRGTTSARARVRNRSNTP